MATPCVVCRSKKKKCPGMDTCLGLYFPEDNDDFQSVKYVFGLSKADALIKKGESQKDREETARCLKFEANCRMCDPVGGVTKLYENALEEIRSLKACAAGIEEEEISAADALVEMKNQEKNHQGDDLDDGDEEDGDEEDGDEEDGDEEDGAEKDGAEKDGAEKDGAEEDGAEEDGADGAEEDGAEKDGAEKDGADEDGADEDGADEDGADED